MKKYTLGVLLTTIIILVVVVAYNINSANKESIRVLVGSKPTTGEKVAIVTETDNFDVLLKGVRFSTDLQKGEPYRESKNGLFIVVDIEVTNHINKPLQLDFLGNSEVRVGRHTAQNLNNFGKGKQLEGELGVGNTYKGQIVFDYIESETYELTLGADNIRSTSWVFVGHELTQKGDLIRLTTILSLIGVFTITILGIRYHRRR